MLKVTSTLLVLSVRLLGKTKQGGYLSSLQVLTVAGEVKAVGDQLSRLHPKTLTDVHMNYERGSIIFRLSWPHVLSTE